MDVLYHIRTRFDYIRLCLESLTITVRALAVHNYQLLQFIEPKYQVVPLLFGGKYVE